MIYIYNDILHLYQTGKAAERWVTLIEVSGESKALTHSLRFFIVTSLDPLMILPN